MNSFRKGHVMCWMSIKWDCFLVCFVQNITYLAGKSDVTTISNDQENILQTSCKTSLKKTWVLLCSANARIGTHVTFPVIPKRCCCFLVGQSFQFENTTHMMYLLGKHSWSIDRKYNYCECWCYIIRIKWCFLCTNQCWCYIIRIKWCFLCTNQWLLLYVLAICL